MFLILHHFYSAFFTLISIPKYTLVQRETILRLELEDKYINCYDKILILFYFYRLFKKKQNLKLQIKIIFHMKVLIYSRESEYSGWKEPWEFIYSSTSHLVNKHHI